MHETVEIRVKPTIVVTDTDYKRLSNLAIAARNRVPGVADELQTEMARATITDERSISRDVVRMGSTVTFFSGRGPEHQLQLVFPADADIAQDKLSVLTPIGTALIGLTSGQSIGWRARDGAIHELTVVRVSPPGN